MDVWIASDADNQKRVLAAIRDFAFPAAPDDLLLEDDAMVRMGEDLKRNKLASGRKKDLLDLDELP